MQNKYEEELRMDIIHDRDTVPDMQMMTEAIADPARQRWQALTAHIETAYKARPQMTYSVCSGKPGWNLKYKKSGKALCTLYPEPESFTALVVLGMKDMNKFELMSPAFTDAVKSLYDDSQLFNNTKWLMISVTNDTLLDDVKKLIHLKISK